MMHLQYRKVDSILTLQEWVDSYGESVSRELFNVVVNHVKPKFVLKMRRDGESHHTSYTFHFLSAVPPQDLPIEADALIELS